jgi:hypothetical protein
LDEREYLHLQQKAKASSSEASIKHTGEGGIRRKEAMSSEEEGRKGRRKRQGYYYMTPSTECSIVINKL